MDEQHIRLRLELPGVRVVGQRERAGGLEVTVERIATGAACPTCGRWTGKCHDRRPRAKADEPLGGRTMTVVLLRRRYRCLPCQRVFTEPDEVCGPRRRLTRRLRERLGQAGVRQPVAQVAHEYGVSPATVRAAVCAYVTPRLPAVHAAPVRRLGIDEFSLRKGRRYATGLHDLDRHRLLEVITGRTSDEVQAALERLAHPELVEVVSMDMAHAFRAAVRLVLPQATITVDKFHVVQRVTVALRQVWRRLVAGKARTDPLRQHGRLVLRNRETLTATETQDLAPVLRAYPELRRAWLLKEDFRRWYRSPLTPSAARLELRAWRAWIATEVALPEFRALAGMFATWGEEILTYFTTHVTQGIVEGHNHRAKVIQRQAYGYRNFANLRLRLLLAG